MDYHAKPISCLKGDFTVPGDKSISHRALIIGAIAEGKSYIQGLLMGADNLATMKALQQLGVTIESANDDTIIIHGVGLSGLKAPSGPLDLANSGTGMRLLTGLLSGQVFDSTLIGDESLSQRPMARIVDPLKKMGASIKMSDQGTPPLMITGNCDLHGISYELPIASAQIKSCLLLAGLYAHGKTCVIEPAPSRDHGERLLQAADYPIDIQKNKITVIGRQQLKPINLKIPADISSAAFFMVAASIVPGSEIVLRNIGVNPSRLGIIHILHAMGADIELLHPRLEGLEPVADIRVRYAKLRGIEIPVEQVPLAIDEFPAIFIAAACANGKTTLRQAKELRVKETDRIAAMAKGLALLGIDLEVLEDGIIIDGGQIQGGVVNSFKDHRIAMSFAVAACVAKDPITIRDCQNVGTSFPNFLETANQLGMNIE